MTDHFLVVGCRQYGDYSYIPVNERGLYATVEKATEVFKQDLERDAHREHVHILKVMHEDPGTSADNDGPWVCIFLRDGFWTITNGFYRQHMAEAHADRHLRNAEPSRKISNVTVRRMPLPESAKLEKQQQ